MDKFEFGDFASFESENGEIIRRHEKQINQKTVTIISENKLRWRVSPNYLRKIPTSELSDPKHLNFS
jgi:hypothetical protein